MNKRIDQEAFSTIDKTLSLVERSRALAKSLDKIDSSDKARAIKTAVSTVKATADRTKSDSKARSIKEYLIVLTDKDTSAYNHREFFDMTHNNFSNKELKNQRLNTTLARDANNNVVHYTSEYAYNYIKTNLNSLTATNNYLTNKQVQLLVRCVGCSVSDNTRRALRQLCAQKILVEKAVCSAEHSTRTRLYHYYQKSYYDQHKAEIDSKYL